MKKITLLALAALLVAGFTATSLRAEGDGDGGCGGCHGKKGTNAPSTNSVMGL